MRRLLELLKALGGGDVDHVLVLLAAFLLELLVQDVVVSRLFLKGGGFLTCEDEGRLAFGLPFFIGHGELLIILLTIS